MSDLVERLRQHDDEVGSLNGIFAEAADRIEELEQQWTTNPPTEPGWYWYKGKVGTYLYQVENHPRGIGPTVRSPSSGQYFSLTTLNGKWSGPLQPPEES
jgi:hypothetical protein